MVETNIRHLLKSVNIILFFKKQEQTYKCLICNSENYEYMKRKYTGKNILVTTIDILCNTLKSEKNFIYKYIFSNEVECIYGEEDFKILRNYIIVTDDYERNLKNIYKYITLNNLKNEERLFYLVIFYQLLNGKMLYETISTTNDMNDFILKNNTLISNTTKFEKEVMETFSTFYSSLPTLQI